MPNDLMDLAARVEAASGPDREIDKAVQRATGDGSGNHWFKNHLGEHTTDDLAPAYTASLDAAMILVPEGWTCWSLRSERIGTGVDGQEQRELAFAATPALALTAACLRARSAS